MESLKEIAGLILLQVDHNRECGKDDKFTLDEIADILNRRVVLKLHKPVVSNNEARVTVCCATCKHQRKYGEDSACNKCFQNYNKWEAIN